MPRVCDLEILGNVVLPIDASARLVVTSLTLTTLFCARGSKSVELRPFGSMTQRDLF